MANSTANTFDQSTDHNFPSLSTHTSKRAQEKAAEKLHRASEEISIPLANSVVRLQQKNYNQQHQEQMKPTSPPVPALAKKLQAQSIRKASLTEFDSHNRSILPPITDIKPDSEIDLKEKFTPVHTNPNPLHVLPPVGYSSQPMVEIKSSSPPVPALAKQHLSQQRLHLLTHNNDQLPASDSLTLQDYNRPVSPELNSESQFTYPPEIDERLPQATNHEPHCLQQTQPFMYLTVSPQKYQSPTIYTQCSLSNPTCFQNPQQPYSVAPQIVSPITFMVPLSPPQLHHQQTGVEIRRGSNSTTMIINDKDSSQSQHEPNKTVDPSSPEQDNRNPTDSKPLHLPPIDATAAQGNEADNGDTNVQTSSSVTATPQLSQQKEAMLQQLALMKKRLLAQQQSITKRRLTSSFKSQQQSNDKPPPLV